MKEFNARDVEVLKIGERALSEIETLLQSLDFGREKFVLNTDKDPVFETLHFQEIIRQQQKAQAALQCYLEKLNFQRELEVPKFDIPFLKGAIKNARQSEIMAYHFFVELEEIYNSTVETFMILTSMLEVYKRLKFNVDPKSIM